jgi:hypothetical protein
MVACVRVVLAPVLAWDFACPGNDARRDEWHPSTEAV